VDAASSSWTGFEQETITMSLRRHLLSGAFALATLILVGSAKPALADCEIGFTANPLVLISVDFYVEFPPFRFLVAQTLGSGVIQALSLQPNCLQIAFATDTIFPLRLAAVASPIPFGEFFLSQYLYVDDGGRPVPFYPWVAPGVLAVAAFDVTTGEFSQGTAGLALIVLDTTI